MTVRVGINGFGRIGRNFFRAARASGADIEFVAANDLGSIDEMAHLLKYDSVLGTLPDKVSPTSRSIRIGRSSLRILSERNPADLPWEDLGVDVVIESTGFFNEEARRRPRHLARPARRRSSSRRRARATVTPPS